MTLSKSWVTSANSADHPFPLNNLPYGVFSIEGSEPHCGVAIGDMILDVTAAEAEGLITLTDEPLFDLPFWNPLMEQGPAVWAALRDRLTALFGARRGGARQGRAAAGAAQRGCHANALRCQRIHRFLRRPPSRLQRGLDVPGPENALPPNWLHIPIGYNGRASSVVVSGTDIRRPGVS